MGHGVFLEIYAELDQQWLRKNELLVLSAICRSIFPPVLPLLFS